MRTMMNVPFLLMNRGDFLLSFIHLSRTRTKPLHKFYVTAMSSGAVWRTFVNVVQVDKYKVKQRVKIITAKSFILYIVGKLLSTPGSQKSSHFSRCVK